MDDTEFGRLLDAYMVGDLPAADRQRLVEAALESPERAIELSQIEDIRESLADPVFKQSLVRELPDLESAEDTAWWRQWFRPLYLVPLTGSALAVVALLLVTDARRQTSPPQIAEGPGAPAGGPGTTAPGRGLSVPEFPPAGGSPATEPPVATPAAENVAGDDSRPLFELPASRAVDLALRLDADMYTAGATASATLMLSSESHVVALVRGPSGSVRHVYPADGSFDVRLDAGLQMFTFSVSGRLDPEQGGQFTLRVFVVDGPNPSPTGMSGWSWLAERARFEEVVYVTAAP